MNSPWGMIFNLLKETSMTWESIMWGISWVNIQMMLADAPRFKPGKKKGKELDSAEDFKEFLKL